MGEPQWWGVLGLLALSVDSSLDVQRLESVISPELRQFCAASQLSFPLKVSPEFLLKSSREQTLLEEK